MEVARYLSSGLSEDAASLGFRRECPSWCWRRVRVLRTLKKAICDAMIVLFCA